MSTIFIVEDDAKIVELLRSYLERYGYSVMAASDFMHILDEFKRVQPDLVLLDINLPRFDGFYWCRQLRTVSHCPILFISAREGTMDQVMALENGADDYITKPFSSELVVAKIRSHLRRAYGDYAAHGEEHVIEVAGLMLYAERLQLALGDRTTKMNKKEAQLLECLLQRVERVVSRERLLEVLWDEATFVEENTLNVYVTRARKKLQEVGIADALETVRGAGYCLHITWGET